MSSPARRGQSKPRPTSGLAAPNQATHSRRARLSVHAAWGVAGLTLVGAALRFYRLGAWSLAEEEIHTLRDSLTTVWLAGARPLLFFLNYHLISPWHPLDEFGLRILPAIFGIAAIPAMYWVTARAVTPRAGLIAALIVTFHPWLVYWSQFARYYSLVFLASTIYPLALYFAWRGRSRTWLATGMLFALIAILAHPSSALLLGGLLIWTLFFARPQLTYRETRVTAGIATAVLLVAVAIFAFRLVPIAINWYGLRQTWGHQGPILLLSYFAGVSAALAVFGAAGLAWLWRLDRPLVGLLVSIAVVPLGFLFLASYIVPVANSYLLATAPVLVIGAASFLDRTATDLRPPAAGLVTLACVIVLLTSGGPRLWSHYQDGARLDFRTGAQYVARNAGAGDRVFADRATLLEHYLPGLPIGRFRRSPGTLSEALIAIQTGAPAGALWILAERRWRGGFNDRDLGPATAWVADRCRLEISLGQPRLDYRLDELQLYRCPADKWANRTSASAGPGTR